MTLSPEDQTFITQLRLRSTSGSTEPPTLDEMKRAIIILRCKRTSAADANAASATNKKPKKSAPTTAAVADALDALDSM